jgi:radical SAM superfamily enzyme YgiQ (UPF0313 family)
LKWGNITVKVLLVHPGGAIGGVGTPWTYSIPLTLPYLASLTPPDVQVELRYLGQQRIDDDYEKEYDLIGISALTTHAVAAFRIADIFKERGRKVVMGGIHPTIAPDDAAEHCDAVVVGEAESLWPQVIQDARSNCLKKLYKEEQFSDLKGIPTPRFDLLNLGPGAEKVYYPVLTSKGCPNHCEFCFVPQLFGGRLRTRPVEHVVRDVKWIVDHVKSRNITFVDDNVIGHRKYAKQLFREILPLGVKWCGECTLDIADDPELLDLAAKSGCIQLSVGMESINRDSLAEVHKRSNVVDRYPEQIRRIQNKGILLVANIMFGFDHDSKESLLNTPETLIGWKLHLMAPFVLRPIMGTKLFERLEKEGRLLPQVTEVHTRTDLATFLPKQMSPEELEQIYHKATRRFYSLPSVTRRLLFPPSPSSFKALLLNLLANFTLIQVPRIKRIPVLNRVAGLVKSLLRIGRLAPQKAIPGL